jgi:hypothetical protein
MVGKIFAQGWSISLRAVVKILAQGGKDFYTGCIRFLYRVVKILTPIDPFGSSKAYKDFSHSGQLGDDKQDDGNNGQKTDSRTKVAGLNDSSFNAL